MKKIDVVILVNAPRLRALHAKATGLYPYLGIRALQSFLNVNVPSVRVICLDGEIMTDEEIRQELKSVLQKAETPLLGLTTILGNYVSSNNLASYAKSINTNVLTVMGGPWATELPVQILSTTPYVDSVVRGDGEEALLQLLQGSSPDDIAGVVTRNRAEPKERAIVPLDRLPWPLAGISTLQPYFDNFKSVYPNLPYRPATVYFKKFGCDQRCPYCANQRTAMRPRRPEAAWKEVLDIASRLGANHFWDIADNAELSFWQELAKLARHFNPDGKLSFFTFVSADRVTPEFIEAFRRAGGSKVFIGFDSHDPFILKQIKAGRTTIEDNKRAIQLVKDANLYLDASFIIGSPGESAESFLQTRQFIAEEIAPYERLTLLLVPVLTLIPGTRYWTQYFLRKDELRKKYLGDPDSGSYTSPTWSIDELQYDYVTGTSAVKLSWEQVQVQRHSIGSLRPDVFSTWSDRPETL